MKKGKLSITIFAAYYHPHVGGYIKNVHELAKRLVTDGHYVKVVTCNTDKQIRQEEIDGVFILRLPCWNLLDGAYPTPKLSWSLLRAWMSKPDVVITQTRFFPTSLLGAIYAWWYPVPLIHVERGSVHTVTDNKTVGYLVRVYDHTLGAWVVRSARVNIGVSQSASDFVLHLGGKNRKVIFNGIKI
jgi:glycosyltransferase involved in cell wall biosynthesis